MILPDMAVDLGRRRGVGRLLFAVTAPHYDKFFNCSNIGSV
jgi:hypothetical protein